MLQRGIEVNPSARNLLCPDYSICLSSAVRNHSTGFTCGDCSMRFDHAPITHEDVRGCGLLLHEIFFHTDRKLYVNATCPRCGKNHRAGSCIGGSARRFCRDCQNYAGSTWAAASEVVYEMRGEHLPAPPNLADEPGIVGSTG